MATEELETSFNTQTTSNQGFNNAPALKIRLDATDIMERVEMFLKCEQIVIIYDKDNGQYMERRKVVGVPKANPSGIHGILNFMSNIINTQVVQGNFTKERYESYIYEIHLNLLRIITVKMYDWAIDEDDIDEIVDNIMNIVQPFVSRLIDNKERESYTGTVTHSETTRDQQQKSGFRLFGGG